MHPPGTTTLLSAHVRPLDNAPFVCTHVSTDSRVHPHVLAHPPRPMWWTKRWRRAHVLSLPSIPHPQPHHSRSGRADHPLANDDFLFNIIDPLEAAPIRKTQHEWLSQNVDKSRVAAALLEVEPALSAANTTNLDADALAHWPKEQLGRALLGAMLRVFVGAPSANLSEDELSRLQAALHGLGSHRRQPQDGAAQRRELLRSLRSFRCTQRGLCWRGTPALAPLAPSRSCPSSSPPLLAAARSSRSSSNGSYGVSRSSQSCRLITLRLPYPLAPPSSYPPWLCVPGWNSKRAKSRLRTPPLPPPLLQEELRTESAEAGEFLYGPKTAAAVSEVMRQLPYAAAIGPPRKLIDDLQLQGGISRMLPVGAYIPNASMLFVMHPGLVLGESCRESGTPPPIRTDAHTWTHIERADHRRIFGGGSRSCLGEAFVMLFLCGALAILLRHFEMIATEKQRPKLYRFKADGELLSPMHELKLRYNRLVPPFGWGPARGSPGVGASEGADAVHAAGDECRRRARSDRCGGRQWP